MLSQMLMEFPPFLLLQALLVLCLCVQEAWFRPFVSDTSLCVPSWEGVGAALPNGQNFTCVTEAPGPI